MNAPVAEENTSLPVELQTWIADLCQGRATISVGHRMSSSNENIDNIPVENLLYLIRTSAAVTQYVGDDEARRQSIALYVADCVSQYVLTKFRNAQYPGD
jgi:hypothetical protein